MNKHQLFKKRNDAIRFLDAMSRLNRNACNFNSGNTDEHEDLKWQLFKEFRRQGMDVVTEAKFKNGDGRADVVVLDTFTIYEVMQSEKWDTIMEKAEKYPLPFFIWAVWWADDEKGTYKLKRVR
jgi:hypothetical protein